MTNNNVETMFSARFLAMMLGIDSGPLSQPILDEQGYGAAAADGTVNGVNYADEDILKYDSAADTANTVSAK